MRRLKITENGPDRRSSFERCFVHNSFFRRFQKEILLLQQSFEKLTFKKNTILLAYRKLRFELYI